MDHQEATRVQAVEKYLLRELRPPEREQFEEHFFDCEECAADLLATAAFLRTAKRELKAWPARRPGRETVKKSWAGFLWRPAFAVPAYASLLLVIATQGALIHPRWTGETAPLQSPEVLPTLSLIGGNSRGASAASMTVRDVQPFLLSLDIPTEDRFSNYDCLLYTPTGAMAWRIEVSAEAAKDTVSIRIPAGRWAPGTYTLVVQGNEGKVPVQAGVDLARYHFALNTTN